MMGGMGGGMMGGMGVVCDLFRRRHLPSALLNAGQTRNLPTRLVSISSPDPQAGCEPARKG